MTCDEAARQPSHPAPIKVPDQLQQAKRPDVSQPSDGANGQREPRDTSQDAGILGQLRTERAHD
jgi:hypothetical protein